MTVSDTRVPGGGHTPLTLCFAGDVMLRKLTDYLLHAGYDCTYEPGVEDDRWIRRAPSEDRVLLTRDRPRIRGLPEDVRGVLVRRGELSRQLPQVVRRFGLRLDPGWIFTRCSGCNRRLEPEDPDRVADRLPAREGGWTRCTGVRSARRCTGAALTTRPFVRRSANGGFSRGGPAPGITVRRGPCGPLVKRCYNDVLTSW